MNAPIAADKANDFYLFGNSNRDACKLPSPGIPPHQRLIVTVSLCTQFPT
jgi:hypothetical protein